MQYIILYTCASQTWVNYPKLDKCVFSLGNDTQTDYPVITGHLNWLKVFYLY